MSLDYRELGRRQDREWRKGTNLITALAGILKEQGLLPERFDTRMSGSGEREADIVRFSLEQRQALEKRGGRTVYVELHGETLETLELRTDMISYLHGEAEEAVPAPAPAMRGVEVAINLDHAIPEETLDKPFDAQLLILEKANQAIDGVTDIYPQTPADALAIALDVREGMGVNILLIKSTRVGKDGALIVGNLSREAVHTYNFSPYKPDDRVGLLSMAVPTTALGR